jgi:DNA repair protein RadC
MACLYNFDSIAYFAQAHAARASETLLALYLSSQGNILSEWQASDSLSSAVSLPVRALTKQALILGADAILLVHNHPAGDPRPSQRDIAETLKLERILFPLSIRIADHVIVAGSQQFSFRASGLI